MKINELYAAPAVQKILGPTLRPGGMILTQRLLELAAPRPDSVILDAGCGYGATLQLLGSEYLSWGLDLRLDFLRQARTKGHRVVQADLAALPLGPNTLDLIICECAWNLADKKKTLKEFYRALRPQGTLALTDIFTHNNVKQNWPVRSCFAQATSLDIVRQQIQEAGFFIELIEDHSRLLKKTAADFIFQYGSLHGFWQAVTGDSNLASLACTAAKQAQPGLFLLLARVMKKQCQ